MLHSFSDEMDTAKQALAMNFYLGISGPVTYKNASRLREIVAKVPLESILVETDAPFLTPAPHRGQRNEPAYVSRVVDKIAEIKELAAGVVMDITTRNASRLLNW